MQATKEGKMNRSHSVLYGLFMDDEYNEYYLASSTRFFMKLSVILFIGSVIFVGGCGLYHNDLGGLIMLIVLPIMWMVLLVISEIIGNIAAQCILGDRCVVSCEKSTADNIEVIGISLAFIVMVVVVIAGFCAGFIPGFVLTCMLFAKFDDLRNLFKYTGGFGHGVFFYVILTMAFVNIAGSGDDIGLLYWLLIFVVAVIAPIVNKNIRSACKFLFILATLGLLLLKRHFIKDMVDSSYYVGDSDNVYDSVQASAAMSGVDAAVASSDMSMSVDDGVNDVSATVSNNDDLSVENNNCDKTSRGFNAISIFNNNIETAGSIRSTGTPGEYNIFDGDGISQGIIVHDSQTGNNTIKAFGEAKIGKIDADGFMYDVGGKCIGSVSSNAVGDTVIKDINGHRVLQINGGFLMDAENKIVGSVEKV